jgi:serine/threonine-protein kinase RsbW
MSDSNPNRILSRLSDADSVSRGAELSRISGVNKVDSSSARDASVVLLLGSPRAGKTELLRQCFDSAFGKSGDTVPFFYSFRRPLADLLRLARDYFSQVLAQFVAFRRNDPGLLNIADEPPAVIARAAAAEDYLRVRSLVDSFTRALESGDAALIGRCAVSAPVSAAAQAGLRPLVVIDNAHLIADSELRSEFLRALAGNARAMNISPRYVLTGRQRELPGLIGTEEGLLESLEIIHIQQMSEDQLKPLIRRQAERLEIETNDSTIELMIEQFNGDPFYSRAIIDAAATRGSLKTFVEFERLYAAELRGGRLGHYFEARLHEVAPDSLTARAALEALELVVEAGSPVPIDAVTERIAEHIADPEALLARLHSHELLDLTLGFVSASPDTVLSDCVRAKYRREIAGAASPMAGDEMLGEKLKQSYVLMMSRYNRAIEGQITELLMQFDSQSVPASLFDQESHEKRYRGMSRVQIRRALDDEQERVRLPQIVLVNDAGSGKQPGVSWRLLAASGFEGGVYTDANEVGWLVALINSKEPVDLETLGRIDERLEQALRAYAARPAALQHIRWYVSKEGFSAIAHERLSSLHAYRSTFAHLDLIQDHLTKLALGVERRPATEFELVIPIEGEAELIAARTAEQIARAADFDTEAINQIKTALIEACINAAEHGESPDGKIYQRFAIDEDKLIITVFNKGKTFGWANEQSTPSIAAQPAKGARGRGLQIIRALMDEVTFDRTDDGSRLVMVKYLKRPGNQ